MTIKKNDKKVINAWAFYDWANSVYPLVITSAIFPIYYGNVTSENLELFGLSFRNSELYTYVVSLGFLIVSIISPLLSGIADYSGNKKMFLKIFCYLGSASCAALYFFKDLTDAGFLWAGLLLIMLASIGFWGSIVFYNAYLPEIATPDLHDEISAKGYTLGYVGSSILLLICLGIVMGIGTEYTKHCFLLVGLWWTGFSFITYKKLPISNYHRKPDENKLTKGFRELMIVKNELFESPKLKRFLVSFFIYSMGLQTVFVVATLFASQELGLPTQNLIISILLIQFLGIAGAILFARWSKKIGNIYSLAISLVIWIGICLGSYLFLDKGDPNVAIKFYITAAFVGFVMGGVQSLSRSTYSKLLPETKDHASYFSFYDVSEKLGIVLGTLGWAVLEGFTGDMKLGIASLAIYFVIGLVLLFRVPNSFFTTNMKEYTKYRPK